MLEEILLFAFKFENCLPPVNNKHRTGWWPHYELEYPDLDKKVIEGDIEVYNIVQKWLTYIPLYDRKILYAYLGTGHKVSHSEAAKKLKTHEESLIFCDSYKSALQRLGSAVGLFNIKDTYKRYL